MICHSLSEGTSVIEHREQLITWKSLQKSEPTVIRNLQKETRKTADIKLPRRFATTIRLEPTEVEREIYTGINNYLKGGNFKKPLLNLLLREAGSSPFALKHSLLNMDSGEDGQEIKEIVGNIDRLEDIVKGNALKEILFKNPDEKKIIFTQSFVGMTEGNTVASYSELASKPDHPAVILKTFLPFWIPATLFWQIPCALQKS